MPNVAQTPVKLEDKVRNLARLKHFSLRTEEAYWGWIRRFIIFHGKRHPDTMGEREISDFLSHLAVNGHVAASTQNQALNALVFLYTAVLGRTLGAFPDTVRAKRPQRLPVVLTKEEAKRLVALVEGTWGLMAKLLYGTGMRLMECVRLRVKDVDFGRRLVLVRDGKGRKDRIAPLPDSLTGLLEKQLEKVRALHRLDIGEGLAGVWLPDALEVKYPNAGREWAWQWVFPARVPSVDPRTGVKRRHTWSKTGCSGQ